MLHGFICCIQATLMLFSTVLTPGTDHAASAANLRSYHALTCPLSVTLPSTTLASILLASTVALRCNAFEICCFTFVGEACGLMMMALVTPFTPRKCATLSRASLRWYCQSTVPVSVTRPFLTSAFKSYFRKIALHSQSCEIRFAISSSVTLVSDGYLTSIFSITA